MIGLEYLPKKSSKWMSLTLIGLIIMIYLFDSFFIAAWVDGFVSNYVIKPILWLSIAFLVLKLPALRPKAKQRQLGSLNLWAFNFGVIFIVVSTIIGLFDGLGKSPYNHTPAGIIMNIFFVGSFLLGRELVRYYLVNTLSKHENYAIFAIIALLLTISAFPAARFMGLKNYEESVKFVAQYFMPEFTHNLMATYLAFIGGPITGLIYMGVIQGFHWLSPILPDLEWITAAFIGIMCPVFSLAAIQSIYMKDAKLIKRKDRGEDSVFGWIATSIVSIMIIWFAVGVFPVYPSVIATGSMEPMIKPGDVIMVKKVTNVNQVQVGDVIQFKRDRILISHRIIEISQDKRTGISFRTKGDNNPVADHELVQPKDLRGKIVYVVPKVGWPTLFIKNKSNVSGDDLGI